MNKDYVLFNLQEAREELDRMIHALRQHPDYDSGELVVAMTHVYHHINTAWNARNVSHERAEVCSERDFRLWRQFPLEIDLSV
jgi:hypothetical protein